MLNTLSSLVVELRAVGIPVSTSEHIDAARSLAHLPLTDRQAVKAGLAGALVKDANHLPAFDTVFDLFFAPGRPATEGHEDGAGADRVLGGLDDDALTGVLEQALAQDDRLIQRAVAAELVDRRAGIEPGRKVAGTYYLARSLRGVPFDTMTSRYVGKADGPLPRRLAEDEFGRRVDAFRQEVEAEIRRRMVADRGDANVARTLRRPLPEDVAFVNASREEVDRLRRVIGPFTRKLAASLTRRRRTIRHGSIDMRRTVRASMSTGGVPVDVLYRRPRPAKPELVILADISGSVAAFAAFTMQLMYALRSEFSKVRSFVFVDGVAEVTDLLAEAADVGEVTSVINSGTEAVWLDGHSDYGNAIETFWLNWGWQIRSRSTLLVLGDARNNYHAPRAWALKSLAQRAGHVFWLNPEPRAAWGDGDSAIDEYAEYSDGVFECRNLRQLRSFVDQLD